MEFIIKLYKILCDKDIKVLYEAFQQELESAIKLTLEENNDFQIDLPCRGKEFLKEHQEFTLVQVAICLKQPSIVKLLMRQGADICKTTPEKKTALDLAIRDFANESVAIVILAEIEKDDKLLTLFEQETYGYKISGGEESLEAYAIKHNFSNHTKGLIAHCREKYISSLKRRENTKQMLQSILENIANGQMDKLESNFKTNIDPNFTFGSNFVLGFTETTFLKYSIDRFIECQDRIVELLLKNKADANFHNSQSSIEESPSFPQAETYTALELAIIKGNIELCKILIQYKANVNLTRLKDLNLPRLPNHLNKYEKSIFGNLTLNKGSTPIMLAVALGEYNPHHYQYPIVKLLLEAKANLNARNKSGKTALHYAICNDLKNPKHFATDSLTHYLLESHASPTNIDNSKVSEGNHALHFACLNGSLSLVELFIERKFDLEQRNSNHETALMLSLSDGRFNVSKALIKAGADFNPVKELSSQVLIQIIFKAEENKEYDLIPKIIEICNNNIRSEALCKACMIGSFELVDILLKLKISPDSCVRESDTHQIRFPIHYAISHDHFDIVKLLCDYGADLNIITKNTNGHNIGLLRFSFKLRNIFQYLLEKILTKGNFGISLLKKSNTSEFDGYYKDVSRLKIICQNLVQYLLDPKFLFNKHDEFVFPAQTFSKCHSFLDAIKVDEMMVLEDIPIPLKKIQNVIIKDLFENLKKRKTETITFSEITESIWNISHAKLALDKKMKIKDNALHNQQAQPLVDQLLKMPKRVADLDYIGLLNGIKKAKAEFEALLEENNKINLKPAKKSSKENARQRRKEDNLKKKNQVAQHIQSALELFDKLEPKFQLFNKIFSRTRKKALEFIENGNLMAAKNRIQVLNDLLEKESKEIQDCGIAILNEKIKAIHTEINILIEICKKNNQEDETIERREETPAEQALVEAKQKDEADRLAQDKKVKNDQEKAFEKQLNRAKDCIKQTQNRMKASDIAMTRSKKKPKPSEVQANETHSQEHSPKSESAENGNSPLRNNKTSESLRGNDKTKNASSGSSPTQLKGMPNSNINGLEVKGNAERDNASDDEEDFNHSLRHPQKSTFASLTELSKKLDVLDESAQIKFILENPPTLDNHNTQKLESYALLLACAKAMHTIKGIQGESIFPRPMAEKFRNTIYHCYPLFQALASNKDLKLTILKSDSNPTEETIHIPAVEMNAKIREMALNLYEYIRLKLTHEKDRKQEKEQKENHEFKQEKDQNQTQETNQEYDLKPQQLSSKHPVQELKQTKEVPVLDPKAILEQRFKEIINAVHSTLFNAILKIKIPVKTENACIEVMNSANLELHAIQKLEKMPTSKRNKIIHTIILKAAKDLIIARLGSFYAYGYDHFASITNDRQYKPYRRFRGQGNITRHNDKTNANINENLSTVQMTAEIEMNPLILSKAKSQEFPKLSEPRNHVTDSKTDYPSYNYQSSSSNESEQGKMATLNLNSKNPSSKKGLLLLSNSARRAYGEETRTHSNTEMIINSNAAHPSTNPADDYLQQEMDRLTHYSNLGGH